MLEKNKMRLAILQINPQLGNIQKNTEQIEKAMRVGREKHSIDLFISPEQALIGYPAGDLLSYSSVLEKEEAAVEKLSQLTLELGCSLLLGHCERKKNFLGKPLYNAASLFDAGKLCGRIRKTRLPSYDVFEEERFFDSYTEDQAPLRWRDLNLFVSICEDGWDGIKAFGMRDVRKYAPRKLPASCDIIVNLSASPYSMGKRSEREDLFCAFAQRLNAPLLYSNNWGAQDEVLFDGASFGVNAQGEIVGQGALFEEDLIVFDFDATSKKLTAPLHKQLSTHVWAELKLAAVVGLRDFITKSGGKRVLLGLSGGIDSALVACIAKEALGAENVLGVGLPSAFSSDLTKNLGRETADRLSLEWREISIEESFSSLKKASKIPNSGLAAENMQSRIRGLILMALANAENRFLLSTGNKSELALGYATLYGDMNGALAPLGDLYKTEVYGLSHLFCAEALENKKTPPIPVDCLLRPPTAELAPDQKDSDSMPEYYFLDTILKGIIENQGQSLFKESSVDKVLGERFTFSSLKKKVMSQEFKRFQSAPLLRFHGRAFGNAWRFPLTKDNNL